MTLRIGTRGSALAMSQAGMVARQISEADRECRRNWSAITTAGDTSNAPVARLGVGVFVSALREALVDKEVDLAVHSYKDLPTAPDDRLQVVAVPPRVDPRDALVTPQGRGLADLRRGPGSAPAHHGGSPNCTHWGGDSCRYRCGATWTAGWPG